MYWHQAKRSKIFGCRKDRFANPAFGTPKGSIDCPLFVAKKSHDDGSAARPLFCLWPIAPVRRASRDRPLQDPKAAVLSVAGFEVRQVRSRPGGDVSLIVAYSRLRPHAIDCLYRP